METRLRLVLILFLGFMYQAVGYGINPKYDTIIVGLGSSGTTAASTLAKAGKRVLALEAQDRVGGRVHTVPFGDGIVEVGAEWIHGTVNSRTYETAINNSITILPQDFDVKVYKSDGKLGDAELMGELISFWIKLMEISPNKPEPLGMYITRKFREYVAEKYPNLLNDTEYIEEFLDIADIVVDTYEGSSNWNDVTSNSNYKLLVGNQEMSWHRYGYKTFFELLFVSVIKVSINPKYDTIIVGLGASGTTAASTLAKAGKRVLALEAQDRVGGRVHTVPFGDGIVELGAEWIHGIVNSRTYETAINNSITIFPQDLDIKVYKSDGTLGDTELMDDLMSFCINLMENPAEKSEPLGVYISREFRKYVAKKYPNLLNDNEFIEEFLDIIDKEVGIYEGCNNWNDVTTNSNFTLLVGNQEMSWHRYGYKTFFELLLNTYNRGPGWPTLDIKLKKEVTLIKWPQNTTGSVEVTCKDGDVYTADNVIVTVSIGVLKERYHTLFSPTLPESKVTAINKISMGLVGKVIFSFAEQWWPKNTSFVFRWLKSDKEKYDKWQGSLKQLSSPAGSSNTLTFWTNGETTKLVETLPEEDVKRKCMEVMRMFLGKTMTIPDPTDMIRSTWYSNPFTRGSYTFDNVLVEEHTVVRAALGAPLVDLAENPRVLFAGEATDLTHFSTVHGASDAGYREAKRILATKM